MKKTVISTIFALLCIISMAQDLTDSGSLYAIKETDIGELKYQTEVPVENLISESIRLMIGVLKSLQVCQKWVNAFRKSAL